MELFLFGLTYLMISSCGYTITLNKMIIKINLGSINDFRYAAKVLTVWLPTTGSNFLSQERSLNNQVIVLIERLLNLLTRNEKP